MISFCLKDETGFLRLTPSGGRFTLLDVRTIKEILTNLKEAAKSPAKVIRIQGDGGCFAVGADLKTMHSYSGYTAKGFSMLGNSLFSFIRTMPQAVIAEIDGFCMGGGMDFAAACDFRFATAQSRFAHPGSKLGIITGFGGTQAIPRIMRSGSAAELFYTGNVFDAKFMKKGGYLTEVFEHREEMEAYSDGFAMKITRKDRSLLAMMKKSFFHKGL